MMSQEPHHLHHHHHHLINEFGNPPMSSFEAAAGHDPFGVEMSANASWRGFASDQSNPAAVPGGGWPGIESSSLIRPLHTNNLQNLSLSLFNPPHPGSSFQPSSSSYHGQPFHFKASKYLLPAQDLLSEFCSLGGSSMVRNSTKLHDESTTSSVLNQQSLFSLEPLELQKRKAKLLSMLEEVDRRYRRYCEQMKAVVSTFEEVAGEGAARTYSMLASKAMSRHFRCLRDGIAGQIKATRRAMGESEAAGAAPGLTRGETPRLKLLDQCLRQQKAFQQVGLMESHPWRPQRGLPERSVSILRSWLFEHFLHPYPSDVDKHILARQTGLSRSQVSNWFINARVRLWKPMVEEMYLEEQKEEEEKRKSQMTSQATTHREGGRGQSISNPNPNSNLNPSSSHPLFEDQKPEPSRCHLHIDHDPHSLSSIITGMNSHHHNPNLNQSFGILDGDFAAYRGHELTLGLQQHERPLVFSREPIGVGDDGSDAVQFSMIEGEGQNIPYRNLMGAQLLHDLAG